MPRAKVTKTSLKSKIKSRKGGTSKGKDGIVSAGAADRRYRRANKRSVDVNGDAVPVLKNSEDKIAWAKGVENKKASLSADKAKGVIAKKRATAKAKIGNAKANKAYDAEIAKQKSRLDTYNKAIKHDIADNKLGRKVNSARSLTKINKRNEAQSKLNALQAKGGKEKFITEHNAQKAFNKAPKGAPKTEKPSLGTPTPKSNKVVRDAFGLKTTSTSKTIRRVGPGGGIHDESVVVSKGANGQAIFEGHVSLKGGKGRTYKPDSQYTSSDLSITKNKGALYPVKDGVVSKIPAKYSDIGKGKNTTFVRWDSKTTGRMVSFKPAPKSPSLPKAPRNRFTHPDPYRDTSTFADIGKIHAARHRQSLGLNLLRSPEGVVGKGAPPLRDQYDVD